VSHAKISRHHYYITTLDVTKLLAIICVPGFGGHSVCHKTMMRNEPLSTVVEMHFLFFFIF